MVSAERVLREGLCFMLMFHVYNKGMVLMSNIIIVMSVSAKSFGSKLIDSHQSYKTFLTNNNPVFNQRMAKIMNKNYTTVEMLHVFEHKNEPTPNLFYFYAQRYNSHLREDIEDYIVKEIDHFLNNYNSSYAVVYVHDSIFDFLAFRRYI